MRAAWRRYLLSGEQAGANYVLESAMMARRGRSGYHPGRHTGPSLDFKDFREYQPGDDLRQIDWGAYARSDKLIVKLFREEIDPHLDLIIDGSRSMALPQTAKAAATLSLAAFLGAAAYNARCTTAVWLSEKGCRRVDHGESRPSLWHDIRFKSRLPLDQSLAIDPPVMQRRGIRILISDLLFPGEPRQLLRRVSQGAGIVVVVQILAQADMNPDLRGNLSVEDCETGATLTLLMDDDTRGRYRAALKALQRNWRHACRRAEASFITFNAEQWVANANVESLLKSGVVGAR